MLFAQSVSHRAPICNHVGLGPARTVRLQVMRADALGWFVAQATRSQASKITIVSPWIGTYDTDDVGLKKLVAWASGTEARLTLITRSPATPQHQRAVEVVASARGGAVLFDERLHAKLYVCERKDGLGFAVLGSANMTRSSSRLHEIAVLVRPLEDGRILRDLVGAVVAELRAARAMTLSPRRRRARRRAR